MKAQIEAQGHRSTFISLDEVLFVSKYRTGNTEMEFNGEMVEMNIVECLVILEKE